ncbi:MAG: hypothetical protein HKN08_05985 [Gammaproteobacteria bacterium]|nr:hypothetical protein [Gammaproteobacteria bacterium]
MNRRNFINRLGKVSVLTTASGFTVSALANARSKADEASKDMSRQVALLKNKVDALEKNQKKIVKSLCVLMAFSTGMDITMLI